MAFGAGDRTVTRVVTSSICTHMAATSRCAATWERAISAAQVVHQCQVDGTWLVARGVEVRAR